MLLSVWEGNAQFHRDNKDVIFFLLKFINLPRLIIPELDTLPLFSLRPSPDAPREPQANRPLYSGLYSFALLTGRPRPNLVWYTRCPCGLSPSRFRDPVRVNYKLTPRLAQ